MLFLAGKPEHDFRKPSFSLLMVRLLDGLGLSSKIGRVFWRGSAKRAPHLKACLPARAGGEPPQWENQADKGVERPAARSARTRPRRLRRIFPLRWGTGGPQNGRALSVALRMQGAFGLSKSPLRRDHCALRGDLCILEGQSFPALCRPRGRDRALQVPS